MANGQRKLEVVIAGDSRLLERAFRRSANASETFGRRVTRGAGQGLLLLGKGGAVAAVAGLAAVSVGLVKSGKAAAEAEASNARLNAQLKAMGKDNATTRVQIEKTVESLSRLGAFDDEDLQDAFTTLVRSSGNVAKSQKDLALVADISRGAQIGLAQAAKLVNRVNAGNVGSLKRYGIALEDGATKEQAIAALRAKFAGQAEAYANTAAGAQEALGVATENTFEAIGVALTPLIIEFSKFAQDVLPVVATAVSKYLGQAIAWVKTNWPQIRAVLVTTWDGMKWAWENVLSPTLKAVAVGIGALVGFVREHMPEIRAAAQAAFGWIQTNVVPTVRSVAIAVGAVIRTMTAFWREHGTDIKAVIGPAYETIKTVIVSALKIIRSTIEFWLAIFRLDFDKAGEAIKTIVRSAFTALSSIALVALKTLAALVSIEMREVWQGLKASGSDLNAWASRKIGELRTAIVGAITELANRVYEGAKEIPRKIGQGIMDAAGDALGPARWIAQKISDILPGSEPKDSSSPLRGLARRGRAIVKNIGIGVAAAAPAFTTTVTDTMRDAIRSGLDAVSSLTSSLGDMLGTIFETSSPEGKRLSEIRAQQAKENDIRRRAELQAAIDSAQTDEERARAQQDLSDYLLDYEASQLEESIRKRREAYNTDLANLAANFRAGRISAEEFKARLGDIIGGATGAELGSAFADQFTGTIGAIGSTIDSIVAGIQRIGAAISQFPGVTGANPSSEISDEESRQRSDATKKWNKWKKDRDEKLAALKKIYRDPESRNGRDISPWEQSQINQKMADWDNAHPQPPKPMAMGGILTRPILAGEAGPEAVLPLTSGRARTMLADALQAADRINGSSGTTVINVTVSGNEFSARDFAKKLQPELNRLVGFGQV